MKGIKQSDQPKVIISNGFEILIDEYNYTLVYNTGKTCKDGRTSYRYLSYHGTFEDALKACRKEMAKRGLKEAGTSTLDDAISTIVRTNNYVSAIIKNAFEGIET